MRAGVADSCVADTGVDAADGEAEFADESAATSVDAPAVDAATVVNAAVEAL
jgi:hypothetical protein